MTRTLQRAAALRGSLSLPGDKSISHRSLLLNALASGEARIEGFLPSADCLSTMRCLRAYGVQFDYDPDLDPTSVTVRSPGRAAFVEPDHVLECGNSGTSMRLLSGIAAGRDLLTLLDGDSLASHAADGPRPAPARHDGRPASTPATTGASRRSPSAAPIRAPPCAPSTAAWKSPLLRSRARSSSPPSTPMASPPSRRPATRATTPKTCSAPWAPISVAAPPPAQAPTASRRSRSIPATICTPSISTVPGDISSAAFWLVAGSIVPDSEIHLRGVGINPTRAGVLDVLRAMGASIEVEEERSVGGEPVADLVVRSATLHGTTVAGDLVVLALDELPVLAVAAAAAVGRTELRDAQELRVKEADRIAATVANLSTLGVDIEERPDGFVIEGGRELHGGALDSPLDSYGDHRLAMAAAVAALIASGPSQLKGEQDVIISYPQFWDDLEELTGAEALA